MVEVDKNPDMGYYKPKYSLVKPATASAVIKGKEVEHDKSPPLVERNNTICTKMIRVIKHDSYRN